MTDTDDAITDLWTRVDGLEIDVRHATDLGLTARREALIAQQAHRTNIDLLNALRQTQADHSQSLTEHSRMHAEHTARFDSIESTLGHMVMGMHNIESILNRLVESS